MTKEEKNGMKVLSLFSGIGAFEKALDKLAVPYELVGYTQLYKQAGNSIGVPVVEHIMAALFDCGALTK